MPFSNNTWIACRKTGAHEWRWSRMGPITRPATTPCSKWKIHDNGGAPAAVSARWLAAKLWREEPKSKVDHKMLTEVKHLTDDVKTERQIYKKALATNSKLRADIDRAKSMGNKFVHERAREKAIRESLENARIKMNKKIRVKKDEVGELRGQIARIREEVENEKHKLRVLEAWGEEHARVKLAEAKLILEDKLCLINSLIKDIKGLFG
ncbi:Unknown protein [Striga hermonthica]|uniref:Uncharacterized protein n=1 Tax=Striga hermonthica TaxID=68872 RepID=A0A9N7N9Q8_STRHE|nr:Unknown protein [Striga hermonthica]